MTQVQLDRKPFAKHIFYRGTYTHNNVKYPFELTVYESENNSKPDITVNFKTWVSTLPFDYGKACKEILAIYIPYYENKN
jgi:hypothetical protein